MRVLIVEDDYANALVTRLYLEDAGIRCVVVENGEEALQKISTENFDAVLMDIGLSTLSGYEVTRAIRARECELGLPRLRIIGVTGYAFTTDRDKCFDAGMDDYLSKPYKSEDLLGKLPGERRISAPAVAVG
jgi:CheY-like chemotaxis protein